MSLLNKLNPVRAVRRAFTLVELLVTISVISILAAMLYAGINTVSKRARDNNLRTMMSQLGMASVSHKLALERNPPVNPDDITDTSKTIEALRPYLKSKSSIITDKEGNLLDTYDNKCNASETRQIGSNKRGGQGEWQLWSNGRNGINEYADTTPGSESDDIPTGEVLDGPTNPGYERIPKSDYP